MFNYKTSGIPLLIFLSSFSILRGADPAPLPVAISPADPAIRYTGRFDTRDQAGPQCSWSASAIALKFSGADLNAEFKDPGTNWWQIEIDDQPTSKIQLQSGAHLDAIVPSGEHVARLIKATEGQVGVTQ